MTTPITDTELVYQYVINNSGQTVAQIKHGLGWKKSPAPFLSSLCNQGKLKRVIPAGLQMNSRKSCYIVARQNYTFNRPAAIRINSYSGTLASIDAQIAVLEAELKKREELAVTRLRNLSDKIRTVDAELIPLLETITASGQGTLVYNNSYTRAGEIAQDINIAQEKLETIRLNLQEITKIEEQFPDIWQDYHVLN